MAKTVKIKLQDTEWAMPASYAAARDVAADVVDPLHAVLETSQTGMLKLDLEQLVSIVHIGVRHAGCSWTRDQVGEAVMEFGIVETLGVVGEYLTAMVSGGPEKSRAARGAAKKKPDGSK